ncbi:unnamed protein product [Larinioides sclopetarius]|uniref:Uncharacterized protein n=1 Tax=Larinioides sclopetarius TaxID=280406 RepID=A0AAV2B2X5_9ARAC
MKAFLLLVFIPSFIAADILCPKSKTTCPEDKKCCEVDGEYSCCDSDVDQEEPAKSDAGVGYVNSVPFANMSYSGLFSSQTTSCQSPSKRCGNYCCSLTDVCCSSVAVESRISVAVIYAVKSRIPVAVIIAVESRRPVAVVVAVES